MCQQKLDEEFENQERLELLKCIGEGLKQYRKEHSGATASKF